MSSIPSQAPSSLTPDDVFDYNDNSNLLVHKKIKNWPKSPRALKRAHRSYMLMAMNLAISFLFLILGITVLCIHGKPVPSLAGIAIQQVSHIGPSIFPIVFTSLMSYAFQSIGQLRSERGIKLNELHFLVTTRNTSDAIYALKHVCSMSLLTFITILIWALSPLGGQASLRILRTTNQINSTTSVARYLDTGPLRHHYIHSMLNEADSSDESFFWLADVEMFIAINQPGDVQESPMDIWGNVKIPWIDTLDAEQPDSWIQTVDITGADSWSSLIGIPIHDLPSFGTKDLRIETSYLSLDCSPLREVELPKYDDGPARVVISCPGCPLWENTTLHELCTNGGAPDWCERLTAFLGLDQPDEEQSADANIIVVRAWAGIGQQSTHNPSMNGWSTTCAVTEKRVEMQVQCNEGCHSKAIRYSQRDKRPTNLTAFDYWASYVLSNRTFLGLDSVDIVNYLVESSD